MFSFWQPGDDNSTGWYENAWTEALDYPGAAQMQHLRRLIESRPFLTRIPDQGVLLSPPGAGETRVQATRDSEGSTLFVYFSSPRQVVVDPGVLSGSHWRGWWFDPRDGSSREIGTFRNLGPQPFTPPPGLDRVLVLDDAERGFPAPGVLPGSGLEERSTPAISTVDRSSSERGALPHP